MKFISRFAVSFALAAGLLSAPTLLRFAEAAKTKPVRAPVVPAPPADAGVSETSSTALQGDPSFAPDASENPVSTADSSSSGARLSPLTPAAAEFAQASDAGAQVFDYDRVISDVAALRARVAAATELMFRSKIVIQVKAEGKYAKIARFNVALDDGVVFSAKSGFKPEDFATVYEHAVAPGRHAVTVDVERADEREDGFRSSQKSRLVVDVPKDHRLNVEVILVDDSTMGGDFTSDRSGRYDLRIRMRAVAKVAQ
jgi:hypothetical protein